MKSVRLMITAACCLAFQPILLPGAETAVRESGAIAAKSHFIKPDGIAFKSVLPHPPASGSLAAAADLETVYQVQLWRTPEQVQWALRVEKSDLEDYADVIGSWFASANLPVTWKLFVEVREDAIAMLELSKTVFGRPRPYTIDPRIVPCVRRSSNDAYPSGHTFGIYFRATLLAEIFPEREQALFDLARKLAWGRVIGGVHYPTDLAGGRALSDVFVAELKKNPEFLRRFADCKAELLRVRPTP